MIVHPLAVIPGLAKREPGTQKHRRWTLERGGSVAPFSERLVLMGSGLAFGAPE
jgi:hypothetical protein